MEEETSAKPKWGPLQAVFVTLAIYFGVQVLAGIVIALLSKVDHNQVNLIDRLQGSNVGQFWFSLLIDALTLGLLISYLRHKSATLKDVGFNKFKIKYIAYALSGFALYFIVYLVGLALAKALVPGLNLDQKQDLGFTATSQAGGLTLIFISLVILPPLIEETLLRGFLFTGLRSKLSFFNATLITSVLFAAAHLPEAQSGLLWVGALDTFILSLILCYLREKTDSLWPSIGVHMIKNGLAFVVLFNIVHYIR